MLHDFITSNRQALIARCKENAARRFAPAEVPAEMAHGVPLFLKQLAEVLRVEQLTDTPDITEPTTLLGSTEIGRSAALHGADLLRLGFSIDQVVHDYGDVCQSITKLAIEQQTAISTQECCTLNRCLDDAIADSVTAFVQPRPVELSGQSEHVQVLLGEFSTKQTRLIQIAAQSFAAMKTGNIGFNGATGTLLEHALEELRSLTERTLPEIRRSSTNV